MMGGGNGVQVSSNAADVHKPELLAPAGGWEQLEYAIRFGADAVYLATDRFGLRQRACNFALDEIPRVVEYAHERGVAVHVTANAQMHDDDFELLPDYLQALDAAGVDAVLVSDLGALRCAKQNAPRCALHVSTQASVSNVQSAFTWYELGARRIVCAREMSLAAIADMRRALPPDLELEVFVHGSMCMAISGRCLISDYLTGRSATNGNCTQPCRWSYALQEEKRPGQFFPIAEDGRGTYIMNAKDMNTLAYLNDIVATGVDSVKIEGRNKKAFYVATVVNAYRQVLDGADPADFEGELDTVSHRPYGTGFFFGPAHQTPESDGYIRPYDWAAEVLECKPADGSARASDDDAKLQSGDDAVRGQSNDGELRYRVTVLCRNRFFEAEELEALCPHRPVRRFYVRNLRYLPDENRKPRDVDVANRTMERYMLDAPFELQPHDILRVQREDRLSKPES